MFKTIIAASLLFAFSANAYESNLTCFSDQAKSSDKDKKAKNSLLIEMGSVDESSEKTSQTYLLITNGKGLSVNFSGAQVDETKTRYHRVILANNGETKARIVVNQAGQADVTLQKSDGSYSILRKVIDCSKF